MRPPCTLTHKTRVSATEILQETLSRRPGGPGGPGSIIRAFQCLPLFTGLALTQSFTELEPAGKAIERRFSFLPHSPSESRLRGQVEESPGDVMEIRETVHMHTCVRRGGARGALPTRDCTGALLCSADDGQAQSPHPPQPDSFTPGPHTPSSGSSVCEKTRKLDNVPPRPPKCLSSRSRIHGRINISAASDQKRTLKSVRLRNA